jgi:hypothetical protein
MCLIQIKHAQIKFPLFSFWTVQPHINNRYIGNFMNKRQETKDFRAHSEMVDNKRVRSLRGKIKGGVGGGSWKGRIRGVEVGGGVGWKGRMYTAHKYS